MSDVVEVVIAGLPAIIYGRSTDAYFLGVEGMARQLDPFVSMVDRQVPHECRIVDAGANIGLSVVALARTRPQSKIFAFEPSPENLKYLEKNLRVNNIENVSIMPYALSNRKGYLRFHEPEFGGAGAHVVSADHLAPPSSGTSDISMTTLDDFAERFEYKDFAFIKIDAEGHEPNILAGGKRFFRRSNPLIYMEFNSWCLNAFGGHSPAAFARSLWKYFEVLHEDAERRLTSVSIDPYEFLHRNLISHGCVDDLILRIRAGCDVPSLEAMTWPSSAWDILESVAPGSSSRV